MRPFANRHWIVLTLLLSLISWAFVNSQPPQTAEQIRSAAERLASDGNFKEAIPGFQRLLHETDFRGKARPSDINNAVQCLMQLRRYLELDELLEKTASNHARDFRVLQAVADNYQRIPHNGMIIAGEFERGAGYGRRQGVPADASDRDRVRAIQLYRQAEVLAKEDAQSQELGAFYLEFADHILGARSGMQSWRLQHLTNLDALPDYEQGWQRGAAPNGAPVDEEGEPILYAAPKSWNAAKSDGERWRWTLQRASETTPKNAQEAKWRRASFLETQFGVATLQQFGLFRMPQDDEGESLQGILALQTLDDSETVCRLAVGVRRMKLPESHNHFLLYKQLAKTDGNYADDALQKLASLYSNRMQYEKSAAKWKEAIARFGADSFRKESLQQIVAPWGELEATSTQSAGQGAELQLRFRNAKRVTFEAKRIDLAQLLHDVKDYLRGKPAQIDWNRTQLANIGYRIVNQNQTKYVKETVASWSLDLKPRPGHFDKRIDVTTPLQKGGVYWVTSSIENGNRNSIVLWVADTALIRKGLNNRSLFLLADAKSGEPLAGVDVDFFGYKVEVQREGRKRTYRTLTKEFQEKSDETGKVVTGASSTRDYQWLIVATTPDGRLAHLGFHRGWTGTTSNYAYNNVRGYLVTDRPVYKPLDAVQFKFWVKRARYDAPDDRSEFAGRTFTVDIHDPKGTKVATQQLQADEYGGLAGEWDAPGDATLGSYRISLRGVPASGGFRLEEYRKPEFEVTVEAPDKPIALGEKFKAKVKANYYFGAPVQNASVKVKVERTAHHSRWYPVAEWDWLYGPGYWWFAGEYDWHPGAGRWLGCLPYRFGPYYGFDPPELVLEVEQPIGRNGEVEVEIDSALAQLLHGDKDHRYSITAEVRDASRRTIVGSGQVLAARQPFKVFTWVDRGYYLVGDTIQATFRSQTLDQKPVSGAGLLKLLKIESDDAGQPVEREVQSWELEIDELGSATQQLQAAVAGQYRLSLTVTDQEGRVIEGGYIFTVRGDDDDGSDYRFDSIEIVTQKKSYQVGDKVRFVVNCDRADSTVYLFLRPAQGVYSPPRIIRMRGKSSEQAITISPGDMPNIFLEAMTIRDGKVHTAVRQVVVPPEKRVLNVAVVSEKEEYLPQEKATLKLHVTDHQGENYVGTTTVAVYDKAIDYIAGNATRQDIREFFWKWVRGHSPSFMTNLGQYSSPVFFPKERRMRNLGVFGGRVADIEDNLRGDVRKSQRSLMAKDGAALQESAAPAGEAANQLGMALGAQQNPLVEPAVRSQFADTALWVAAIETDRNGLAEVSLNMPENLTTWKVQVWGVGHGGRVGSGETELITTKNVIVRLQSPRFFTENDEAVLSAVVHNYLPEAKDAEVSIQVNGPIELLDASVQNMRIKADGEARADWKVRVTGEGEAVIRVIAKTDAESDAMEMTFPCHVFGAERVESFVGSISRDKDSHAISLNVPLKRRIGQTRLEVRYSPSLAAAMVDALPYLVDYPYGCTEQTLNRFLPAVITQRTLQRMNLDLEQIRKTRTNLNAQELGERNERAKQWKRFEDNPVLDSALLVDMVSTGVKRLTEMQNPDGGWGWFGGYRARSWPHTSVIVIRGLRLAQANDVAVEARVLERGLDWLAKYQKEQLRLLNNHDREIQPSKAKASDIDALVYQTLVDAERDSPEMRGYLYRDRVELSVYAKAVLALAMHQVQDADKLAMLMRNLEQFLVHDDENETSRLDTGGAPWWYWHGDEIEANAYYLKLLAAVEPKSPTSPRLVKYLLNNRKHATYWKSTRDTAICVEAFADYLKATGELNPDMTVEVWLDGKKHKEVQITRENLFTFDNRLVVAGGALSAGKHRLELRRKGEGPLYFNAYLTNFTLEDSIEAAGLEVRVERRFYKLVRKEKTGRVAGSRGQSLEQAEEAFDRIPLEDLKSVVSGDLVEVELKMTSKNDYEYVLFEDKKAAGLEPVDIRSGYLRKATLSVYQEMREDRVGFFMRRLPRGVHSLSYRLRAETPGRFGALPAQAYAMYAPELRGNSADDKVTIIDQ